jgi:hypothetical protein
MMNGKGFGRKRAWSSRGTIPVFAWRDGGTPRKNLRIAGLGVESWNPPKEGWYNNLTKLYVLHVYSSLIIVSGIR